MPETPAQTARRRANEQRMLSGAGAADVARKQMQQASPLSQGYTRGTEPAPPRRQIGTEPAPLGLSAGASTTADKERRRREKVARGEPLTQSDL